MLRFLCAAAAALWCMSQMLWAQDETRYFASGWPIALAEAACWGDEACLTRLANCGPGTDGICTFQVARCTEVFEDALAFDSLCTVYLAREDHGASVMLRLPNGKTQTFADHTAERAIFRAVRQPSDDGVAVCSTAHRNIVCFTHLIDSATLRAWADGTLEEGN